MFKFSYVSFFVLLLWMNSYAGDLGHVDPQNQWVNLELKEGKWKETCFESELGRIVNYQFSFDKKVNFNIHWHEKKHVTYSVKHEAIKILKGSFEPSIKKMFCLSWYADKKIVAKGKYKYSHKKIQSQ